MSGMVSWKKEGNRSSTLRRRQFAIIAIDCFSDLPSMQFFLRRKFRLGAAEHDLDAVAAFVATLVVFDDLVPDFSARDAGRDTLLLQGIAEPVGIIASVCQHPLRFGQTVEQSGLASVVADLSGRQEEADRTTIRIASLLSVRSAIVDQIKEMDRRLRVIASQSQACEIR